MAVREAAQARLAVRAAFLMVVPIAVGLCVAAGTETPRELVPPVKVIEHVERLGPDFYRYDWPVAPGAWPTIKAGELEYPVGVWQGGFRAGPYYDSIAEWYRDSGFDFAQAHIHVDYTVTGKEAAEIYRKYLLGPAQEGGGRIVAHVGRVAEPLGYDAFAEFVKAIKDHPALMAYDPADEPSLGDREDQYVKEFKIIRAIDPEHPIRAMHVPGGPWWTFRSRLKPDKVDILGCDFYPIQGGASVRQVYRWADWVVESAGELGGVMSSMCLGIFGEHTARRSEGYPWWPGYADTFPREKAGKGRLPTIPEMRNQVYQCVVAGVQQIMWFYYEEWLYDDYGRKDLHDELERLNQELHILTGPIYSTTRYPVNIPSEKGKEKDKRDFYATASLYHDALYVIVLSVAEEEEMKPTARKGVRIELSLPPQTRGRLADEAVVLFDRAGCAGEEAAAYWREKHGEYRTVPVDPEGAIVDDFGEYEVHVYRIALSKKHKEGERLPTLKK